MPRLPRRWQWTQAACYHLIDRGHNRETVLHDDEDRRYFLQLLARYGDRFGLRLYHYCLMSNHFHLLVQLPNPRQLSSLMAVLLRAYAHHLHRRHGFVGRTWQGRFKSPAIEAESYLLSCGRYIERNPCEARLVALPWEYRWSSCRAYALGEADGLLASNPWYEALAPDAARRQPLWVSVRPTAWLPGCASRVRVEHRRTPHRIAREEGHAAAHQGRYLVNAVVGKR